MRQESLSWRTLENLEDWLVGSDREEYFQAIKCKKIGELRQNGEFLYLLVRMGYSPLDIDQDLDIRVRTIERRMLKYLKELDEQKDTYEDYSFLFEHVIGFPWTDIYRRYMKFDLSEDRFVIREGIDKGTFQKMKDLFSAKGMQKYEGEIRLSRKLLYEEERKRRGEYGLIKRHIKPGLNPSFKIS